MSYKKILSIFVYIALSHVNNGYCQNDRDLSYMNSVSGDAKTIPERYVPPLISNGSLCMLVDYQGCQFQRSYEGMIPSVWWAGRRYGPPDVQLIPFGHFGQELTVDGVRYSSPTKWTQTLNTKEAVVTCFNDYGNLSVETSVFTPLSHDLIVIKKRFSTKAPGGCSARMTIKYQLTPPGNENLTPKRTNINAEWDASGKCMNFSYRADGYQLYNGIVSLWCDQPVTATNNLQASSLSANITLNPNQTYEMTFYLSFADSMDGKDYLQRAAKMKVKVQQDGFDGLLAEHKREWAAYWNESYVRLPDIRMEKAYNTAQYHLRANATKWSFPVGIFNTHWAGKFFGWDEMFCFQGLASSNHLAISKRVADFRYSGLKKALQRAGHYGKPGVYGAHYPWEALEDGADGTPPGFWIDHVFQMSHIALSAWLQYLYTEDLSFLKMTGFPVIKECARFYMAFMIYKLPDGSMFLGKCTDLERLGPAKLNPFMTSCGAIYTLEAASKAATLLNEDKEESATWVEAATKLRQSLPNNGERYLPYPDCKEESVASLGGLFPYPIFGPENQLQRNAAYNFITKGRASGNMYPMGSSICAWYAGWMASALALLGDKVEPAKLMEEAVEGAGCFAEMFEINEPKVSMHPWFSTASGNVVYALNQMLVQSKDKQILIAPAVPDTWKDFSFKLACYGNLVTTVSVSKGRITKLVLSPGNPNTDMMRTLIIPEQYLDKQTIKKLKPLVTFEDGFCRIDVQFKGEKTLINLQ